MVEFQHGAHRDISGIAISCLDIFQHVFSVGTGWPSVTLLSLGKIVSLILQFVSECGSM